MNMNTKKSAEQYIRLGWSIVPIGPQSKIPEIGWRRLQTDRMDLNEFSSFADKGCGIGIVLGTISGNLVVRDFDIPEAYRAWKASYPHLAGKLPTVRTARGFHVYCRATAPVRTQRFADGELRGDGGIIVAPPTLHPISNRPYTWIIEPFANPPVLEVAGTGLGQAWHTTGSVLGGSQADELCSLQGSTPWWLDNTVEGPLTDQQYAQIDHAIRQTVPLGVGGRNDGIFRFARKVLFILSGTPDSVLANAIGLRWFHAALPSIGTLDPAVTVADFARALRNVRKLEVKSPVGSALDMAEELPVPSFVQFAADIDPNAKSILLAKMVVAMDLLHAGGVWYLSSHYAASYLGMKPSSVYSLLQAWVTSRILEIIERGSPGKRGGKANRYRLLIDKAGLA